MPDERMWMISIVLDGGSLVDVAVHDLTDFDHVFDEWKDASLSCDHVIEIEGVKGFDRAPQRTAIRKDRIMSMTVLRY